MVVKSLNQWLQVYGYTWVDGRELLLKGEIGSSEAQRMISQLYEEGAIKRG